MRLLLNKSITDVVIFDSYWRYNNFVFEKFDFRFSHSAVSSNEDGAYLILLQ